MRPIHTGDIPGMGRQTTYGHRLESEWWVPAIWKELECHELALFKD
jgi:hypothetical protein